jgi:cyclopropane fatty-acyl-phospholipid synthase-like methyltransferase
MQDYASETMVRLLRDAGVRQGMRVLDIGCGRGLVTQIARDLVGAEGFVLGVDRDAVQVSRNQGDAPANVAFAPVDLAKISDGWSEAWGTFDAIVTRRVLMYLPDPAETLRALVPLLRAGGCVVAQEIDFTMVPASLQAMPLHAKVNGWMRTMIEREGADPNMGFHLASVLTRAGLTVRHVRAEGIVQTASTPFEVAPIVRAVMPRLIEHKVVSEADVDLETLSARLHDERASTGATFIGDMYFGAWGTVS